MKTLLHVIITFAALFALAATAAAQSPPVAEANPGPAAPQESVITTGRPILMQHFRPQDQRGVNVFETPKDPGVEYTGFKLDFGAAFASQFQALRHENAALPNVVNGVNANQLIEIGNGFNNSTANLYLHAQLAEGIRVQLSSYLSSRHHPETWVKDGFILIDASPIDIKPLHTLMKYATLKVGHFEINYGDAHFRRSETTSWMPSRPRLAPNCICEPTASLRWDRSPAAKSAAPCSTRGNARRPILGSSGSIARFGRICGSA
jgi:hypothetical protein